MSKRSNYLNQLLEAGIICEGEEEIIKYGLNQALLIAINLLTVAVIGSFFKMLWQSVVFMVAYIPLRSFAGGYHARTQIHCYLFSIVLASVAIMAIKNISWTGNVLLVLMLPFAFMVYILAPIEDCNKPLTSKEQSVFKGRTRSILLIECLVVAVFSVLGFESFAASVLVSIAAVSMMLLLGRIDSCCTVI